MNRNSARSSNVGKLSKAWLPHEEKIMRKNLGLYNASGSRAESTATYTRSLGYMFLRAFAKAKLYCTWVLSRMDEWLGE